MPTSTTRNSQLTVVILITLLLVSIGLFRITLTYGVYWQIWDEPFHIAAGMEWLDKKQYTYEQFHPPLARVMSALGPYMSGIRGVKEAKTAKDAWIEGGTILHANGTYERNLTLARTGILPFFIICAFLVAWWGYLYGGVATSLTAALLFTTLPTVLAHSGFATLDMACGAMVATSLFFFIRWLEKPSALNCILWGGATALAILSKLSALGFLVAAGGLISTLFLICSYLQGAPLLADLRVRAGKIVLVLAVGAITIWGGYRFSLTPALKAHHEPVKVIDRYVGSAGKLHDTAYAVLESVPVPAPEFFKGIHSFFGRNSMGHLATMFGKISDRGWWYFFPLSLLVKTPLPFILFSGAGLFFIVRNARRTPSDTFLLFAPVAGAAGLLIIGMMGHVNNGLRQLLCIYPLLAVVSGYGAAGLLSTAGRLRLPAILLVSALLLWQTASSISAHPDYLSYFNELGRNQPERFGVDSDLDWGQDLKRLATAVKKHGITTLSCAYSGSDDIKLQQFGFPEIRELVPYRRETGWVAISIHALTLGTHKAPYDQFAWLKGYKPVEKIGSSILLYRIPEQ